MGPLREEGLGREGEGAVIVRRVVARRVWNLFSVFHLAPSRIDAELGLPSGTAALAICEVWRSRRYEIEDKER